MAVTDSPRGSLQIALPVSGRVPADRRHRRAPFPALRPGHGDRGRFLLSYRSAHEPVPLTAEEEAYIVFAASGFTGYALAEQPFGHEEPERGGGNIMESPFARTIASPDAVGSAILFVLNDDGAFQIRRPRDYPKESPPELVELARRHEFVELYERPKIRVADRRPEIVDHPPYTPPFNRFSANQPGSTYFILVSDPTPFVFSLLFMLLGEGMAFCIFDERNGYRPAGLKRFMRSKGGHLHDDPNDYRVGSILDFESYIMELAGVEQGLMLQNMHLAAEALGLGGFPHYGAQRYQWLEVLGFRMEDIPLSQAHAPGTCDDCGHERAGKEPDPPAAARPGGRRRGDGEAVLPALVRVDGGGHARVHRAEVRRGRKLQSMAPQARWLDTPGVQAGIDRHSQKNVDAVVAYVEYVYPPGTAASWPTSGRCAR